MVTFNICAFSRTRSVLGIDYMAGDYTNGDPFYTFSFGIAIITLSVEWRIIKKGVA